jgi:hypothetical protein
MLGEGCPEAIVLDEKICVVLHDRYFADDGTSIVEVATLRTSSVLAQLPDGPLEVRVRLWLSKMAIRWDRQIPSDQATSSVLIQHVVPALAGGRIREVPDAA